MKWSAKKSLGLGYFLGEESPEATAGDFGAFAGESGDGSFGVFGFGFAHFAGDFEPVADVFDFAEGDAGLGHAVGAGVHAHEEDALGAGAVFFKVVGVGFPSVFEGVVGMGDWFGEGEAVKVFAEGVGGGDEWVHGAGEKSSVVSRVGQQFACSLFGGFGSRFGLI